MCGRGADDFPSRVLSRWNGRVVGFLRSLPEQRHKKNLRGSHSTGVVDGGCGVTVGKPSGRVKGSAERPAPTEVIVERSTEACTGLDRSDVWRVEQTLSNDCQPPAECRAKRLFLSFKMHCAPCEGYASRGNPADN